MAAAFTTNRTYCFLLSPFTEIRAFSFLLTFVHNPLSIPASRTTWNTKCSIVPNESRFSGLKLRMFPDTCVMPCLPGNIDQGEGPGEQSESAGGSPNHKDGEC